MTGLQVYIYQASLLCEDCGEATRKQIERESGSSQQLLETGTDSEGYPQGPYPDGGGEADCPQHCDQCELFLENPLTGDGETYTRDAWREYVETGHGRVEVLKDWRDRYEYVWSDFESITYPDMEEDGLSDKERERFATLSN